MKWFELVEDLGDGSSAIRRFKTREAAEKHEAANEDYCYSGIYEVDTESQWFWHEEEEEDE